MATDMTLMTPDEVMDRAADAIDTHGWCVGFLRKDTGELCTVGALRYSVLSHDNRLYDVQPTQCPNWKALEEAARFITPPTGPGIMNWNDHHCRNRDEAAGFLRSEAKRYREENQS